jgi:hypothetical protein
MSVHCMLSVTYPVSLTYPSRERERCSKYQNTTHSVTHSVSFTNPGKKKNRRNKVREFLTPADWSQRRRVPGSDLCLPQDTTGSQRYAASHAAVDDGRHGHGRLEVEEEAHGAVALVVTRAEEKARGRRAWKRASYSAACSWMTSRQATN